LQQRVERDPQPQKEVPVVNPADKYADKAEALHRYGQYLMSCLPKYIQQCVVCTIF
jgi:NADH dehydrogenase (ubiquinone) Fe-S protein 3